MKIEKMSHPLQRVRKNLWVLLGLFLSIGTGTVADATTVSVSGRQLLVNCSPFLVRGMNYGPTPIGTSSYEWASNIDVCNADFAQMKTMGVNAIRVYFNYSALFLSAGVVNPSMKANYDRLLASAAANGIYVIAQYAVPYGVDYSVAGNLTTQETQFEAVINLFKNGSTYPAILMWVFSNENNNNLGPMTTLKMYQFYQNAISHAKTNADSTHPYSVALVQNGDLNGNAGTAPAVDVWSMNIYQDVASAWSSAISGYTPSQPLLITEFGNDAMNNATGAEDDANQSTFFTNNWPTIGANLSALNSANKVLGACIFEWNDEWWKYTTGNASTHDSVGAGQAGNVLPDGFMNEEWFGLGTGLALGTTGSRTYRTAFTTMKNYWTASPYNTTSPAICGTSPTFTPTVTMTPVPTFAGGCVTAVDNYNNGAGGTNSFGGGWASVSDSSGSTGGLFYLAPGYTGYSMQYSFNVVTGGWTEAYSGLSATANPNGAGVGMKDLSSYGRITFWVMTSVPGAYWFKVASIQTYGGAGFVWYQATFNATTTWTQVSLDLSAPTFTNPGANTGTLLQNLQNATQIVFQPQAVGSSILWVDDINLVSSSCLATNTPTFTNTNSPTPTRTNTPMNTNTPTNSFTQTPTVTFTPTRTYTPTFTTTFTSSATSTFTLANTATFTRTSTGTSTFTASSTPTFTATSTFTPTKTNTPMNTSTFTSTNTNSPTFTYTFTRTNTPVNTFTSTSTSTNTNTIAVTNTPTRTSTSTSTFTASSTPTFTSSSTASSTSTFTSTRTNTSTATSTGTSTNTPTSTSTVTSTPIFSFTFTNTPTVTSTSTNTLTRTNTATFTLSATPTASATGTNSFTSTATRTFTSTSTNSSTSTSTGTPTSTGTSTNTPVFSYTPTVTPTNTAIATATATFTSTPTATFTSTNTSTRTSTATPTFTFTRTTTPTSTATPSFTFTLSPFFTFTSTFTRTFTSTPTPTSTGTATFTATRTFTLSPTATFTPSHTTTFTPTASMTPTPSLTATLTASPTATPVTGVVYVGPYPNPSNGGPVNIRITVPNPSTVHWSVFSQAFRKIRGGETFIDRTGTIQWDLNADDGTPAANGLYYIRVKVTSGQTTVKIFKVMVIR